MEYDLRPGFIYKITSPDKKIYIGQTINIAQRKAKYKSNDFKGQKKLWNHCKKYKWNPIDTFEIIDKCLCGLNKVLLNEKEIFWIDFFKSDIEGLNCNKGGHGNLGKKHSKKTKRLLSQKTKEQWDNMTEEIKKNRAQKISDFGKTRKHKPESIEKIKLSKKLNPFKPNKEFRNKISQSLIGKPGRNTGNRHSEETKNKISNSKKGKTNFKSCKKILCITNGKIYNSLLEASQELNVNKSKISMVCNGKRVMTGGYKFKFL